jgi:hypothetical protein
MVRTVCGLAARFGAMRGSVAMTARFTKPPATGVLEGVAKEFAEDKSVACAEVWTAESAAEFPVSEEERLRGGDGRIEACLMVDTLRVADAETVAASLSQRFPDAAVGIYRLLCEIRAEA